MSKASFRMLSWYTKFTRYLEYEMPSYRKIVLSATLLVILGLVWLVGEVSFTKALTSVSLSVAHTSYSVLSLQIVATVIIAAIHVEIANKGRFFIPESMKISVEQLDMICAVEEPDRTVPIGRIHAMRGTEPGKMAMLMRRWRLRS